jgi:hypothetical protein
MPNKQATPHRHIVDSKCPQCIGGGGGGGAKENKEVSLPFTLESRYLQAKEEYYENSNISLCKNIIFKKSSERNQNPSFQLFFIFFVTSFCHFVKNISKKCILPKLPCFVF